MYDIALHNRSDHPHVNGHEGETARYLCSIRALWLASNMQRQPTNRNDYSPVDGDNIDTHDGNPYQSWSYESSATLKDFDRAWTKLLQRRLENS